MLEAMVRVERAEDQAVSAQLLPEPLGVWEWSRRLVETDGRGQVAAVAGLWRGPQQYRCDLRTHSRENRVSALTALWDEAKNEVRQRGADVVVGLRHLEFDTPEAADWLSLGFQQDAVRVRYESSYQTYFEELDRTLVRLRVRGKIPVRARIVDLREAPAAEVVALLVEGMGMTTATAALMLSGGGPQRVHPALSCVAACGDEVVAVNLTSRVSDDVARLDSVVVKTGWRGGWANVWVKHEAARRAIASGKSRIIAETGDHHGDSRRQARRNGSRVVGRTFLPVYRFNEEGSARG